jgi:hypothetical protein
MESYYLDQLYAYMKMLECENKTLKTEILALQIQAAESENRADEERHKRIAILMRV